MLNTITIIYDGFGNKKRVDYSVGPETVIGGDIPAVDSYTVTSSRLYSGKHIFTDGELEYSGFKGGYFGADGSANYYIIDWQGNVAVVINDNDGVIQATNYYPYGEPLEEPSGQPYLFGGKERDHAAGRNTYDFGARQLLPYGQWSTPDSKSESFYPFSPYSYCGGDPINRVDRDGREWEIRTSHDEKGTHVAINITGVLINLSSQTFDMVALNNAIKSQLEDVFTFPLDGLSVSMTADIRIVESMDDIVVSDHVFTVVDQADIGNPLAPASTFGYNIKIGTKLAAQTITGENQRTIAHELGHSGGLMDVNLPENDLVINDPGRNLMTQIRGLNRNTDINACILLEPAQINRLIHNFNTKSNKMSPYRGLKNRVIRMQKKINSKHAK